MPTPRSARQGARGLVWGPALASLFPPTEAPRPLQPADPSVPPPPGAHRRRRRERCRGRLQPQQGARAGEFPAESGAHKPGAELARRGAPGVVRAPREQLQGVAAARLRVVAVPERAGRGGGHGIREQRHDTLLRGHHRLQGPGGNPRTGRARLPRAGPQPRRPPPFAPSARRPSCCPASATRWATWG